MTQTAVLLDMGTAPGVATITLNRPQALNALDHDLTDCLRDAVGRVELESSVRAVILRGAGDHFMAGGDIRTFHDTLDQSPADRQHLFERFIAEVHEPITRIRRMAKPVIASVQGAVAGFGLSLMNSCDLVVAADNTYFTMAYCRIGASPDGSGTFGLPRAVGIKRAMEIALLGDRFDAEHALQIGLVNRVVPLAALVHTTSELAARLAAGPTLALGRTKQLLNESLNRSLTEQLLGEQECFAACSRDADFAEGLRAFLEKRAPQFKGN